MPQHRTGQEHDRLLDRPRIEPALTPEEWAEALANEFTRQGMLAGSCDPALGNDHRRAALSLYGQPFGFTAEDVALLTRVDDAHDIAAGEPHSWVDLSLSRDESDRLWSLIKRLSALLPPA